MRAGKKWKKHPAVPHIVKTMMDQMAKRTSSSLGHSSCGELPDGSRNTCSEQTRASGFKYGEGDSGSLLQPWQHKTPTNGVRLQHAGSLFCTPADGEVGPKPGQRSDGHKTSKSSCATTCQRKPAAGTKLQPTTINGTHLSKISSLNEEGELGR